MIRSAKERQSRLKKISELKQRCEEINSQVQSILNPGN